MNQKNNDTEQIIDWKNRGYYRFPLENSIARINKEDQDGWKEFGSYLEKSKKGDFVDPSVLWDKATRSVGWQIGGAYCYLIGHTAPQDFLKTLREAALDYTNLRSAELAARSLAISRLLSEAPTLLEHIKQFIEIGEFQSRYWDLSRLLGGGSSEISDSEVLEKLEENIGVEEYSQKAMGKYNTLKQKYDKDIVCLLYGEPIDIKKVTSIIIDQAENQACDPKLRELFESTTGIDCSNWYSNREPQLKEITKSLQNYLSSGVAKGFTPGLRYFFGHSVPN